MSFPSLPVPLSRIVRRPSNWAVAVSLLLAACGGGGGSSDGPPPPTPPELQMFAGTWGPSASVDGKGTAANFYSISDMAFDPEGNLLVMDWLAIRKVSAAGDVTTLAQGTFVTIAIDNLGQIYAGSAVGGTCRIICSYGSGLYRLTSAGTIAASYGIRSASSLAAYNGDLYYADYSLIRRLAPSGEITIVAGVNGATGSNDGPSTSATFGGFLGLAIDADRNIYAADSEFHNIRKIAPDGTVTTLAGVAGVAGSVDGPGASARFNKPFGIAVDGAGNLYVADTGNCTVRKIDTQRVVSTVAGSVGACNQFIGGALPGALHWPRRVAVRGNDLFIGMRNGIAVVRNKP